MGGKKKKLCTIFPCLSEFQAKAGLFGEGLQKLPGGSFKVLITVKWHINAVTLSKIFIVVDIICNLFNPSFTNFLKGIMTI